jgi:hypothetical protein
VRPATEVPLVGRVDGFNSVDEVRMATEVPFMCFDVGGDLPKPSEDPFVGSPEYPTVDPFGAKEASDCGGAGAPGPAKA